MSSQPTIAPSVATVVIAAATAAAMATTQVSATTLGVGQAEMPQVWKQTLRWVMDIGEHHDINYIAMLQMKPLFPIFIAAVVLVAIICKIKPKPVSKRVPGPPTIFGIGMLNYVWVRWATWPAETVRLSNLYRATWGGPMPNMGGLGGAAFFVVTAENVKHVLHSNFDNYVKGPSLKLWYGPLLRNGILVSDGDEWAFHRKFGVKFFSTNMLGRGINLLVGKLGVLERVMDGLLEQNQTLHQSQHEKADGCAVVNIQDMLFRLTVDVISQMLLGVDLESIQSGDFQHEFALALDRAQQLCFDSIIQPLSHAAYMLQCTKDARDLKRSADVVHDFTDEVIEDLKRQVRESPDEVGDNLVSRFILTKGRNGELDKSDVDTLHDIVVHLLIGGRDTTACALAWTFYELTKKPAVVKKIIDEVRRVFGDDVEQMDLSPKNLGKLKYTHAVAWEALRLHPSVVAVSRFAVKADILPDGTPIPKGAMVNISPFLMGRYQPKWGDDVMEFKPERFFDMERYPTEFELPIFLGGKRRCIGHTMALTSMKAVLAYLLPRYEFLDVEGHGGEYNQTLVMPMKGGFPVHFRRRASALSPTQINE